MTRWDADGAFGLVSGCAVVVGAAVVAAVISTPGETVTRLVVMSLAVAGVTALTRDRRASAGVAALAVLIFVGFLINRDGVLTGSATGWAEAGVLPVAALAGFARRAGAFSVARDAGDAEDQGVEGAVGEYATGGDALFSGVTDGVPGPGSAGGRVAPGRRVADQAFRHGASLAGVGPVTRVPVDAVGDVGPRR